jgi:hypothetical protein
METFEQKQGRVQVAQLQFRNALVGRPAFGPATICTTGSRQGPTDAQKETFILLRGQMAYAHMRNGAAEGWDRFAATHWSMGDCEFWPSNSDQEYWARKFVSGSEVHRVHAIRAPLDRNRTMVNESHGVIAAPMSSAEVMRSGTWATIRYARKAGKPVLVIWPNGEIVFDGSMLGPPESGSGAVTGEAQRP